MKTLRVESWSYIENEKKASKSFFKELSRQLSPEICKMISDEKTRNEAYRLLCISFEHDVVFDSSGTYARLEHNTSPLIICKFTLSWRTFDGKIKYAWEEFSKDSVEFSFYIDNYEKKKLNWILSEIYHPIISSKESGLPYDYQIVYGASKLRIYFKEELSSETEDFCKKIILEFCLKNHIHVPACKKKKLCSGDSLVFVFEENAFTEEKAIASIFEFENAKGIKKIVLS